MRDQLDDSRPFHNGKVEFHVSGVLLKVVKQRFVWGAQDIMDLGHLVHLVITWEQRKEGYDFEEDAANTPEVHFVAIVAVSEEALRCSIPPGGDVLCEGRLRVDASAGTEVGQLDAVVLDEDILAAKERKGSDVTDNCETSSALTA